MLLGNSSNMKVKLLDSLMVSLDQELVDIAKGMKEFVGPSCTQAHAALAQVVKVRRVRSTETNSLKQPL